MTAKERAKREAARRRKAKAWAVELMDAVMLIAHRSSDMAKAAQGGTAEEMRLSAERRDVAIFAACDLLGRIS